jgi:beta-galactosidase GanA
MRAGEGQWSEPVRLLEGLDPDNNSATAKASVWSVSVWAESADHISVAYDLVVSVGRASDVYLATWTKGGKAAVSRLEGWPVQPTPRDERVLRLVGLPDGSLIVLYVSGSYLEVALWWNGEVLATSEEQLPGTVLDMDFDPEGRLHVVGTSEEGLWYRRGTPGWIGH